MAVSIAIKVVPGASRSKVAGWLGHELKLRVSAPPEKGKANQCVEQLLAKSLNLAPKQVKITRGHTSSHKIVEIQGIDPSIISAVFGAPDSG